MKLFVLAAFLVLTIFSCKTAPNSDKQYADARGNNVFRLRLNPEDGSHYYYTINNESTIDLEVNDKKVRNIKNYDIGVSYDINRDSTGNFLLSMSYDKIHLYTKSGDNETDIDADNASFASELPEKMLGMLKKAKITATINPGGETKDITGYKELGEQLMSELNTSDINIKKMVKDQWEKLIGEEFVKKNIDQLFKMFPDSAIHVGDKWKLNSTQGGDFNFKVNNFFTLKGISNDIASIQSAGEMTSELPSGDIAGLSGVAIHLNGQQEGNYKMETKTGMMISSKITGKIKGTLQMMGRDIPVVVKTSVKIVGRKMK